MKVSVYYVSDKASRDERFDAMAGKLLPLDRFEKVSVVELPACFTPREDYQGDWRLGVCEVIWERHQAVDKPVIGIGGRIRSMSVGDFMTIEGEPGVFLCSPIGFKPMEAPPPS